MSQKLHLLLAETDFCRPGAKPRPTISGNSVKISWYSTVPWRAVLKAKRRAAAAAAPHHQLKPEGAERCEVPIKPMGPAGSQREGEGNYAFPPTRNWLATSGTKGISEEKHLS